MEKRLKRGRKIVELGAFARYPGRGGKTKRILLSTIVEGGNFLTTKKKDVDNHGPTPGSQG